MMDGFFKLGLLAGAALVIGVKKLIPNEEDREPLMTRYGQQLEFPEIDLEERKEYWRKYRPPVTSHIVPGTNFAYPVDVPYYPGFGPVRRKKKKR